MSLLSSLGLDDVAGDPNTIPDGKYDGIVSKSEFVLVEAKKTLNHVITYQVTDGDRKGATKQQWYTLYTEVADANGGWPSDITEVKAGKPALSDSQKEYYKKLWMDLGIPGDEVTKSEPQILEGRLVTFGVKRNAQGYQNVNFVEPREAPQAAVQQF